MTNQEELVMGQAEHIPVVVGVGQINDRPSDPEHRLDPLELMDAALREADADAGGQAAPGVQEAQAQAPGLGPGRLVLGRRRQHGVDRDEQAEPPAERPVFTGAVRSAPVQLFARQAQLEGDRDRS